jgi:hypothetical protein
MTQASSDLSFLTENDVKNALKIIKMENFTWNKLKVVPVDTENNSFAHFKTFVTKFIGFYKTYSKDLICEITIFSSNTCCNKRNVDILY